MRANAISPRETEHSMQGINAILKHGSSSLLGDISGVVTIKYDKVFALTSDTGDISPTGKGHGIYFRDTCYLDRMELLVGDKPATSLLSDTGQGFESKFELTNAEIKDKNGERISKETLSIQRTYSLKDQIKEQIIVQNMRDKAVQTELTLTFGGKFQNMFEVRGAGPGKRGNLHPPRWEEGELVFEYDGADKHKRKTSIKLDPMPDITGEFDATYLLDISKGAQEHIVLHFSFQDQNMENSIVKTWEALQTPDSESDKHAEFFRKISEMPAFEFSNPLFQQVFERSTNDLKMLATAEEHDLFVAAGVPWYVTLFGRDSCASAFEMAAFQPEYAKRTLLALARHQGTKYSEFQDEEPGKIIHERRVGEKSNLHEVPQFAYYGSVDSTPWFLMLLGEYVQWTGDIALFKQLEENVERALRWMADNAGKNSNGFLEYGSKSEQGLINQGWKDSGNSIVNEDGTIADPPIALVEVQGYAFRAKREVARLYRSVGHVEKAEELDKQAKELQQRFHAAYWMDDKEFFALALQKGGKLVKSITSNPGQTLFSGITNPDKADAVIKRLMLDDMYCGWGIRTLSSNEEAYNPLDYQVGSVWPHDNALIAVGFQQYGYFKEVERIFTGLFQASTHFKRYRLPEVFDGFSKNQYEEPVHYPVACNPQAWASGAIPLLLKSCLGLEANALEGELIVYHPHLPDWLQNVIVRNLVIGQAAVDLKYVKEGDSTLLTILGKRGDIKVTIEY